ncbi:MAG TPA: hypothetical protein VIG99_11065 [Myxococcaceae bacterium]|jgi:hypothetical protein
MQAACYLLIAFAAIATIDDWYYHQHVCRLRDRPECQAEVHWHNMRSVTFAFELLVIANLHLRGAAVGLLAAIVAGAWYAKIRDVLEETRSRSAQGGLPPLEYLIHVIASATEGAFVTVLAMAVWPDLQEPTGVDLDPPIHVAVRWVMSAGGVYAVFTFLIDLRKWVAFRARLRAS